MYNSHFVIDKGSSTVYCWGMETLLDKDKGGRPPEMSERAPITVYIERTDHQFLRQHLGRQPSGSMSRWVRGLIERELHRLRGASSPDES